MATTTTQTEQALIALIGGTQYRRAIGYPAAKRALLASLSANDRAEAKRMFVELDRAARKIEASQPRASAAASMCHAACMGADMTDEAEKETL